MYFVANPAPVYFTKCGHTVNIPSEPTPVQCPEYLGTDQWHEPLGSSTTTSSTNRKYKCPVCLRRERGKDGKDGTDKGSQDRDKDDGLNQAAMTPAVKAH
jgi:hypothetical protein